MLQMGEARISS